MGYNFFGDIQISNAIGRKLGEFRSSLGEAVSMGKNITFADRDIAYSMKLQRDRIARKGLELDYDVYLRDENNNQFHPASSWKDAHYESTVCFNPCGRKRIVKKNGKVCYKDDRKSILYETVTDVITGTHPDDDPISCPNCGAVSTVAGLQNGCAYCGTRFQMDELFPKVTSYYFIDDVAINKSEFKTGYIKAYFVAMIATYILMCILKGEVYLPWNLLTHPSKLISTSIGIVLGSIPIAYVLYAYFLFMRLIFRGASSSSKMGTIGSRKKFEARMKTISPEFSFEYFTSRAQSLIKTAVLSDDERQLTFYEGTALDPKMKDIIDMNYGGALGCLNFREDGNFVTVITKAYFDVLYATDSKVYYKPEAFTATFRRRTDIPVNFNFSMSRIACPSCGASFDATKIKNCPYCGNKYEITSDDWALVELK